MGTTLSKLEAQERMAYMMARLMMQHLIALR